MAWPHGSGLPQHNFQKALQQHELPHARAARNPAAVAAGAIYVSSYYYICVLKLLTDARAARNPAAVTAGQEAKEPMLLILLYMCPHTSTYVSSSFYVSS